MIRLDVPYFAIQSFAVHIVCRHTIDLGQAVIFFFFFCITWCNTSFFTVRNQVSVFRMEKTANDFILNNIIP